MRRLQKNTNPFLTDFAKEYADLGEQESGKFEGTFSERNGENFIFPV